MNIITEIEADAINIKNWLEKEIGVFDNKVAPIIVGALEVAQKVWATGIPDFVGSVLDTLTKSGVPEELIQKVGASLPLLLADALAITTPQTQAQEQVEVAAILAAYNVAPDKTQVISTVAAELYNIVDPNNGLTFFERLKEIQSAYEAMKTVTASAAIAGNQEFNQGK